MKAPSEANPRNLRQINAMKVEKYTFSRLQRCRWQHGSIFTRLAVVATEICKIPRDSIKNSNL